MRLPEAAALELLADQSLSIAKRLTFDSRNSSGETLESLTFPLLLVNGEDPAGDRRSLTILSAEDRSKLQSLMPDLVAQPSRPRVWYGLENTRIDGDCLRLDLAVDNAQGRPILTLGLSAAIRRQGHPESSAGAESWPLDPLHPLRRYQTIAIAKKRGFPAMGLRSLSDLIYRATRLFYDRDALHLVIDPILLSSDGKIRLSACRLEIDDDALFRQPELRRKNPLSTHPLEAKASAQGISYVELGGNIAIISAGAGSGMAVVDMVHHFGGRPANFVDTMGGASIETIRNLADLILDKAETDPAILVILMVMHLSATPLKPVVETFVQTIKARKPAQPIVGFLHAGAGALLNYSLATAQTA